MWRKGQPNAMLVGMHICAATMENSMEVSQKIKNRTTIYNPAISFPGIYTQRK